MNDISKLQVEVNLIKSIDIRRIVEYVLKYKTPKYFWESGTSSSSTGAYHPKNSDGSPISLVDHTKSATRILKMLLSHPIVGGQIDSTKSDLMIASIILHDVAKRGISDEGNEYTVHEHPILVSLLGPEGTNGLDNHYFSEIVRLASSHSGVWRRNNRSSVVLPEVESYDQYLVHLADWLSSRVILKVDTSDNSEIVSYLLRQ